MHSKSKFVFWMTLILYIITLCTVSYVGVYLTYIAIPLIVISGLIMRVTKPKEQSKDTSEIAKATSTFFGEVSEGLDSMNSSLEKYNEKTKLINQRTEILRNKRNKLELEKVIPEVELKYAKDQNEINKYNKLLNGIDEKLKMIDIEIEEIKKQCELHIEKKYIKSA